MAGENNLSNTNSGGRGRAPDFAWTGVTPEDIAKLQEQNERGMHNGLNAATPRPAAWGAALDPSGRYRSGMPTSEQGRDAGVTSHDPSLPEPTRVGVSYVPSRTAFQGRGVWEVPSNDSMMPGFKRVAIYESGSKANSSVDVDDVVVNAAHGVMKARGRVYRSNIPRVVLGKEEASQQNDRFAHLFDPGDHRLDPKPDSREEWLRSMGLDPRTEKPFKRD